MTMIMNRKDFLKKQDALVSEVSEYFIDGEIDWDLVSEEYFNKAIVLYFGEEADTEHYYEAIEDLDSFDYSQAVVTMVRNDRNSLSAAVALQELISDALRNWIKTHIEAHSHYDPSSESREDY